MPVARSDMCWECGIAPLSRAGHPRPVHSSSSPQGGDSKHHLPWASDGEKEENDGKEREMGGADCWIFSLPGGYLLRDHPPVRSAGHLSLGVEPLTWSVQSHCGDGPALLPWRVLSGTRGGEVPTLCGSDWSCGATHGYLVHLSPRLSLPKVFQLGQNTIHFLHYGSVSYVVLFFSGLLFCILQLFLSMIFISLCSFFLLFFEDHPFSVRFI